MNIIRYILVVCYFALTFFMLSACTEKNKEKTPNTSEVLHFESRDDDEVKEEFRYLLRLENETLTFYEITPTEERVLKAINFNKNYYPPSDIINLEAGISIKSLEEGYGIMENFSN